MRAPIFAAVASARGKPWDAPSIAVLDAALDTLGVPSDTKGPTKTTSATGRALIKSFEGERLKAYPDPATGADPWTIGVGHTGPEVKPGMTITAAQSDAYLVADLARFERAVNKLAPETTQGQFDAMVSLAFNVGEGNLAKSTLLKLHNAGNNAGAAAEFSKWNKAAGRVMNGLTRRRAAEAELYRS